MIRYWTVRIGIAALILGIASCKDVPVDPDTGTIVRVSRDSIPTTFNNDTVCADCVEAQRRTSEGIRQAVIRYRAHDSVVPAKVTEDSLEFEPKVLLNSVTPNSGVGATSADILSFELITDLPEIISQSNIDWNGNMLKSIHVFVPEMKLQQGAVAQLAKDPRERAGASVAYRLVGTNAPLKEMVTGDTIEGNVSIGKMTLISLNEERRIAVCHIYIGFWYRDASASPTIKKLELEMDVRFGY